MYHTLILRVVNNSSETLSTFYPLALRVEGSLCTTSGAEEQKVRSRFFTKCPPLRGAYVGFGVANSGPGGMFGALPGQTMEPKKRQEVLLQ